MKFENYAQLVDLHASLALDNNIIHLPNWYFNFVKKKKKKKKWAGKTHKNKKHLEKKLYRQIFISTFRELVLAPIYSLKVSALFQITTPVSIIAWTSFPNLPLVLQGLQLAVGAYHLTSLDPKIPRPAFPIAISWRSWPLGIINYYCRSGEKTNETNL